MAHILPDGISTGYSAITPLTEEECVRHGGHCYERIGIRLTSVPPQYPEKCKHCGKGRVAIPQEPFTYRDVP